MLASSIHQLCLMDMLALSFASWTLVTKDGPSARSMHTAVWASSQLWIHGGSGESLQQDLWSFDVKSNQWRLTSDITDISHSMDIPRERQDHVAVWDPEEEVFWIQGGYDGSNFLRDLWKYSAAKWAIVTDSTVFGPSGRSEHAAVWDTRDSALWIHGGFDGVLHQDLWKFNSKEGIWTLIPHRNPPSARAQHVAVWDPGNMAMWVHGGYDGGFLFWTKKVIYV